jgi:phospholipid/cholesterol/gamma-HCH transport system substrate-binding protein
MRPYSRIEISVGLFVVVGVLAVAYLSLTLGGLSFGRDHRYTLSARFASAGDLKVGDPVKVAGVTVGEVTRITLEDYAARAEFALADSVKLPTDTIASIKTAGLLGDAYVSMSPGAAQADLPAGGSISRTEPAISILDLIAKYAFGSAVSDKPSDKPEPANQPAKEAKPQPFSDPLE